MPYVDSIPSNASTQLKGKSADISGQRFGMLVALNIIGKTHNQCAIWKCACDCGNDYAVDVSKLRRGRSKSCGCNKGKSISERNKRHGLTRSKIHEAWCSMRYRCENPADPGYDNYGGRGITVCERWQVFENFLSDMGFPSAGQSIDRIDNSGNYEPSNCRWASAREQANNRRSNVYVTFQGETHTLSEWRRILGIKKATVNKRRQLGWTIEQALGLVINPNARKPRS